MKALTLHHLALGARDPDLVAAFYRDVLDLSEATRHYDGEVLRSVWLRLGEAVLMVERIAADTPRDEVKMAPGLFLLAIAIDESDRETWRARLRDAGHPVEDSTAFTDYARDPEGNRVALSFYPVSSQG